MVLKIAPHILLLVFDDMRPWFKPFADSGIEAPNLEALASTSKIFRNSVYHFTSNLTHVSSKHV